MTALPLEPLPSRVVAGRYQLLEPLGRGGMSIVWRSEDLLLRRLVAVKEVLLPRTLPPRDREVLRERLMREARAACAVLDPAAVTVHDVVEEAGTPYLVMELVRARTLAQVIAHRGPLPIEEVAQIGLALLGALSAAHRADVVHRDVKPGNVLVTDDGRTMLTDFGIAATTTEIGLTEEGVLLGSPAYVAPERARGAPGGPESDLWSLGSTLYTAVEGTPAYEGPDQLATLHAVVDGRRRRALVAGPLAPILAALLDRPASRRPDARELESMLRLVLAGPPAEPVRGDPSGSGAGWITAQPEATASAVLSPDRDPGRSPHRQAVAVGLVALAVLGTLWSLQPGTRHPRPTAAPATTIAGARLTLPEGWHEGAGPDSVSVTSAAGQDATGALLQADRAAAARVRQHRLVAIDGASDDAEWEYADPGVHVLVRGVVVDGQLWEATATTTETQWPAQQQAVRRMLAGFRPLG